MTFTKATVLVTDHGMDKCFLTTELPSPFPLVSDQKLVLSFDAQKGTGVEYIRKNLSLEPTVIQG